MSAKKQSAITSFFTRTPKAEKPEKVNEEAENPVTTPKRKSIVEKAKKEEKVVLKRSNSQTVQSESDNDSPVKLERVAKNTPKRQKVVLSSSSEDDSSDDEDFELDEKHAKKKDDEDDDESTTDTGDDSEDDSDVDMEGEEDGSEDEEESDISEVSPVNTPVFKRKRAAAIAALPNRPKPTVPDIAMDAVAARMDTILSGQGEKRSKQTTKKGSKGEIDEELTRFDHEGFEFFKPENIRDAQKRPLSHPEYDAKTLWVPPEFLNKQTPGHRQWWLIKSAHFDTIILFKVGKFYETYHMDAVEVVRALNIAFMRGSYAHAGFPEHAASKFADQLMNHGYKVARVEQTETPQQLELRNSQNKEKDKVVNREVCRVTCNGTRTYGILDGVNLGNTSEQLDPTAKYLLAIKEHQNTENGKSTYGVCMIDTTTANIKIGQFDDDDYRSQLRTLLANIVVAQVLVEKNSISTTTKSILGGILSSVPIEYLLSKKQFLSAEDVVRHVSGDDYYGSETSCWPDVLKSMMDDTSVLPKPDPKFSLSFSAFGAIFWYLRDSFIDVDMLSMRNIELYEHGAKEKRSDEPKIDWKNKKLVLDGTAVENLNIVPNDRDSHQTSLYHVINKCATAFGRRLLRSWLLQPICDPKMLKERQDAITWMTSPEASKFITTSTTVLKKVPDLDRLLQKIHTIGLKYRAEKHPDSRAVFFETLKTNQRKIQELLAAIDGFKLCNKLRKEYSNVQQNGEGCELLDDLLGNEKQMEIVDENIEYFEKMFDRSKAAESGKIVPNKGCDDEYEAAVKSFEEAEAEIEEYRRKIERKFSCKVKYVSSGKLKYLLELPENTKVSSNYELKSRRKGFVRYLNEELEKLVENLDVAAKQKSKLADDATRRVFEQFGCKNEIWAKTVESIASFDVLLGLSLFSEALPFSMCMPEFDFEAEKPYLIVDRGVHPCLALQATNNVTGNATFIANSTTMGDSEAAVMLLTGPNMGGKSTLMRQTAVLCVLAHIGSMVPASSMRLTPIDRIFTRIGANDRIMCGESTFFIELKETDVMLKNATKHSLLLLDELGRGTSTFDGTAIASSVLQNIADNLGSRTFFSTHYHSICNSFLEHPNVRLAHMKCVVDEENEEDPTMENVTFLYELDSGICPKSYGFYAAKLAGIDLNVVRKAYEESNKFLTSSASFKLQKLIESAKNEDTSIDELRKMIEEF